MQELSCLKHQFLLAMPKLKDSYFAGAVVYLCEHNSEGAMGLVLNRTLPVGFFDICEQLDLPLNAGIAPEIFAGGPVRIENGFVLHREQGNWGGTLHINEEAHLTSSKDILRAIASGSGPKHYRIALGCSSWSAGQLEEELRINSWLTVEASPELIFDIPATELYTQALAKLGVSIEFLCAEAGHA